MFRKTAWRNTVSDALSFRQDQALNTTIFLLKTYGPMGFLLREDGETRNFKVCLGDPHTCTCPVFTKEQEPCKHIFWILLRKFRLPREHDYSFQNGLVDRQILEVLHGLHQTRPHRMENDPSADSGTPSQPVMGQEAGSVCRKVIQAQDVCPICQEELLEKKQPVSHCRFGCGNNVHISCMKVWADHQKLSDTEEMVKCPLCREDFSSLKLLKEQVKNAEKLFTAAEREKPERHLGVLCHICQVCPITGRCFKCIVCSYFYLCEGCAKRGCHPQHQFASRTKRRDKWHLVAEDLSDEPKGATCQPANDSIMTVAADPLPENVLGCLPTVRVRSGSRLLDEGQQCRICLQNFTLGQRVRILPCHHKFHMDCVDGILRKTNSCPLDGYVIFNPLIWRTSERKTSHKLASCPSSDSGKPDHNLKDLFIPGTALRDRKTRTAPPHGSLHLELLTGSSETFNIPQKLISDQFLGLCITTTDAAKKEGKGVLQKKQSLAFPESSCFDQRSKSDSGDRQNTCSSKKTLAKCSSASPNMFVPVAKIREQPQVNLFVGFCRSEASHTATVAFPARRTTLQPRRRGPITAQVTNKKPTSELRMTGVSINTQHHRNTET
ncbi:E3 ubiquitin-protein ligase ZSWIM2 isoform X2 [Xiphias gladius]|nr:E3 ubiquitin-protein ligase ZSWIM2 isoform X2 [Xiphias gladius]XP_039998400.1 E3 ubiquitin-protein ligase ZSWIM2 isoform X2 [Xiphias gladius]XP_039998401.1 E3 ubiquitin-protein ligase ZSWIM2 isoform X2 [Xiphias gladius]